MLFRKCLCFFLSAVCFCTFAGCGESVEENENIEVQESEVQYAFPDDKRDEWVIIETDAVWETYTELSFAEYLEKTVPAALTESYVLDSCVVTIHEDWLCEGLLDENDVTEGSRPLTYVVEALVDENGTDIGVGFKFYMELNSENFLRPVAFESYREGSEWGDVYYETETQELLEEMMNYL